MKKLLALVALFTLVVSCGMEHTVFKGPYPIEQYIEMDGVCSYEVRTFVWTRTSLMVGPTGDIIFSVYSDTTDPKKVNEIRQRDLEKALKARKAFMECLENLKPLKITED